MEIEKYKKELESAIYEGITDGTYYIGGKVVEKVLKDAINEALAIYRVSNRRELLRAYEKFTDPDQNMKDTEQNISWFLGE